MVTSLVKLLLISFSNSQFYELVGTGLVKLFLISYSYSQFITLLLGSFSILQHMYSIWMFRDNCQQTAESFFPDKNGRQQRFDQEWDRRRASHLFSSSQRGNTSPKVSHLVCVDYPVGLAVVPLYIYKFLSLDVFKTSHYVYDHCGYVTMWRYLSYSPPENRRPLRLSEVQLGRSTDREKRAWQERRARSTFFPPLFRYSHCKLKAVRL